MNVDRINKIKESVIKDLNGESTWHESDYVEALEVIIMLCDECLKDKQELHELKMEYSPYNKEEESGK